MLSADAELTRTAVTGGSAAAYLQSGKADAVSFGRPFATNPNLITPTYAGTAD